MIIRLLPAVILMALLSAAAPVLEAPRYENESFLDNEGIVYVSARLRKGPDFGAKIAKSRLLRVDLYHETTKKFYFFSQKLLANRSAVTDSFSLPVGNYRLVKITVKDDKQVERSWYLDTSDYPVVRVKQGTASNLGKWIIAQRGKDRLDVEFLTSDNLFVLADPKSRGGIRTAIDGFSGVVLEKSEVFNPIETADYGFRGSVVAEYSYEREVHLSYELNLFREAKFVRLVKSGIDRHFAELSQCYGKTVSQTANPEGNVLVSFVASPAVRGLKNLRIQQSDLRHAALQKCVTSVLQGMRLNVPKTFLGVLTLRFRLDSEVVTSH